MQKARYDESPTRCSTSLHKPMLRITESESTQAAKQYFCRYLRRGDYYFEGHEIVGQWGGKGAHLLGLTGQVDRDTFLKLLDNQRADGKRLTSRTVSNRRPGYDFTFDVPKSVSLLHALSGDTRIADAMRTAMAETMGDIEAAMCARVRKSGAFEDRQTGNMIYADFTHFTSRPAPLDAEVEAALLRDNPWLSKHRDKDGHLSLPDPHLHVHVYVINATYDEVEEKWKAGEFMRLKRDASYYQAAYHARLAGELQKLGYEIEATDKAFEIRGTEREVSEVYSRRTKEVEAAAKALGIEDADAKGALGAKTRRGKNFSISPARLTKLWKAFVEPQRIEKLDTIAATAKHAGPQAAHDDPAAARAGIQYALGRELERVSEVPEKRLLATALERAVGRASVNTVYRELPATAGILAAFKDGQVRLTTTEILKEESALMQHVRDGRGRVPPIIAGSYQFKNPLFRDAKGNTQEQRAAIEHVMRSQDWVVGVIGRAGTGKTTLLQEIAAGVSAAGKRLVICAPTAEAARGVLRAEGFSMADTAKRLLTDTSLHRQLRGAVLWIDEAGMLGNRDMLALLKLAKANGAARVVLAGDPSQNRSVPRGDAFEFLEKQAGLSIARLEKIQRQKTPALKAAVEAISRGNVDRGFELLNKQGAIVEADAKTCQQSLAKAYAEAMAVRGRRKARQSVLVVSPTHREGEAITVSIREELRASGRLEKDEQKIPRTVNLSWTEPEKTNPAAYKEGMVVQFKQNTRGFLRSERVRVVGVEADKVSVLKNDGAVVALPLAAAKRFQVYRLDELAVAVGDRLRVTENGYAERPPEQSAERFASMSRADHGVRLNNGAIVTVTGFTESGDIQVENGKIIPRHYGHLAHGYVVTADAAQSKTVDVVLAAIGSESIGAANLRRFYVTISRARHEAKIFTHDRVALLDAVKRDTPRLSATELVGQDRSREIIADIQRREAQRQVELAQAQAARVALAPQHVARRLGMEGPHV